MCYFNVDIANAMTRSFLHDLSQRMRGWCERIQQCLDCRLGADSSNSVGESGIARYSELSALRGIQVVPRKFFRPEHFAQDVFY